jgi:hypothetical protein
MTPSPMVTCRVLWLILLPFRAFLAPRRGRKEPVDSKLLAISHWPALHRRTG